MPRSAVPQLSCCCIIFVHHSLQILTNRPSVVTQKDKKTSFRSTGQEQAVRTPNQGFQNKIPLFLCHPDQEIWASGSSAAHKHQTPSFISTERIKKLSVFRPRRRTVCQDLCGPREQPSDLIPVSNSLNELEAQNRTLMAHHNLVVKEKNWRERGRDRQLLRLLGPGSGRPSPYLINWNQAADQQQQVTG